LSRARSPDNLEADMGREPRASLTAIAKKARGRDRSPNCRPLSRTVLSFAKRAGRVRGDRRPEIGLELARLAKVDDDGRPFGLYPEGHSYGEQTADKAPRFAMALRPAPLETTLRHRQ